jgi:hypothetical protein
MPLMARVEQWLLLCEHPDMVMVRLRGNTECLMLAYRP